MKDKWAMCAMGAWLAGTILVAVVATENFYTMPSMPPWVAGFTGCTL